MVIYNNNIYIIDITTIKIQKSSKYAPRVPIYFPIYFPWQSTQPGRPWPEPKSECLSRCLGSYQCCQNFVLWMRYEASVTKEVFRSHDEVMAASQNYFARNSWTLKKLCLGALSWWSKVSFYTRRTPFTYILTKST